MSSFGWFDRIASLVMVAVFVTGWLRFDPVVAVAGLALAMGVFLVAKYGRRVQRSFKKAGSEPRLVNVELRPPSLRYRDRAPVSFNVLGEALNQARVGKLEAGRQKLVVESPKGERVELSSSSELVTLHSLHVTSTSAELALKVCDALVREVGPMRVRLDGVEMEIDGTQPEQELSRLLWIAQTDRVRQLEAMLHVAEKRKDGSSKFVQ